MPIPTTIHRRADEALSITNLGTGSSRAASSGKGRAASGVPESAPPPAAAAHPGRAEAALPLPELAALELPVPKFVIESASSARRWMVVGIGIVAVGGVLGAAFQVREMWLPQVLAAIRPAPPVANLPPAPALGLNTVDRQGQLQIGWDRNSPSVRRASDAILEITDGGPLPVAIQLDPAHLETGSFTYARTAEKVDVLLIVHRKDGPDLREVTSFLGKLPDRKSAEELEAERKQREEMAMQAAKLKADMNSQAAKTKKLENEVESMRKELRQQQRRRLNNQLPDK